MKHRRKFTPEYKAKLVLEMMSGQRSVAEIARKESIKDTLLHEWRAEFIRNAPTLDVVQRAAGASWSRAARKGC